MTTKLLSLETGCDWADAGYEILVVPKDLNIWVAYEAFKNDPTHYYDFFSTYLIEKCGATWPDLETINEDDL